MNASSRFESGMCNFGIEFVITPEYGGFNMFQCKDSHKLILSFSVAPDVAAKLRSFAKVDERSMSQIVERALKFYFQSMKEPE